MNRDVQAVDCRNRYRRQGKTQRPRVGRWLVLTGQYYGRPPLLDTLLLPDTAERPGRRYLDWHREKIFVA